ncbi:RHS repeat-associated core domain-containing protein [Sphaerisporangium sp. NPDC049002]|uniref:RHS repeat-associated core domain-containing protein n=1 Tax=unclassified Sphaerisporangium TaxID=2630420 RepID=UPI0033F730C6
MTLPGNKVTDLVVNPAGEITQETNPRGKISTLTYDLAGRTVKVTDPLGNATTAEYDLAGRQTAVKDLDGTGATVRTFGFGYDADSNQVSETSGEGFVTRREYDATGVMTKLIEPVSATDQITTTYGYDGTGAMTRTTDGRGNTELTTYNTLGLVESVVEPATAAYPNAADRTWTNVYDVAGNTVSTLQPGGLRIDRQFDQIGRMTRESGSGAPVATPERAYGYDLAGHLTSIGDYTLEYNDRELLTKVSKPTGQVAAFTYDGLGNPTQRVDGSGTANFTWDNNDSLATAADPVSGRSFTYGYDDADRLTTLTSAGPATTQSYTYDAVDRLKTHTLKNNAGSQLAKITYGWDKDDHLLSKTTVGTAGAGANTYGYDRAGRLTSWTAPGGATTTYSWDASGNRTMAGDKSFVYDERNRLLSGGGTTYSYSPRGTLNTETIGSVTRNLVFDAFDRLVNDGDAAYGYDALGRLTSRAKGGTEQRFAYSGLSNDMVTVTDGAGTVQSKYGRDPFGELLSMQEGGQSLGAMTDLHGDVVGTFSGTTLVDSVAYNPFGEVTNRAGTSRSLGYQGEYTDPETGKVNMHARWYQPGTGGFASRDDWSLSPDPSIQINRYTYVNGDPLDGTDPSGHAIDKGSGPRGSGVRIPTGAYAKNQKEYRQIQERQRRQDREDIDRAKRRTEERKQYAKKKRDDQNGDSAKNEKRQMRNQKNKNKRMNDRDRVTNEKRQMRNHKKPTAKKKKRDPVNPPGTRANPRTVKNPPASKSAAKKCSSTKCSKNDKSTKSTEKIGQFCQKRSNAKKPQCAGNANHEYGGNKPRKSPKQDEHDVNNLPDLCKTSACRNSVTPVTPKGRTRDVLDDLEDIIDLAPSPEDVIDLLTEDAAPDLPPSIPPGMDGDNCSPNSFVAGTPVLMADGTHKPIERVAVGDQVLATDPETGRTEAKPVITLIKGEGVKNLVRLTIDVDGDRGSATDELTATDGHPFWLPKLRQWLTAGQLEPGMWLQTSAGTYVQITALKRWTTHQRVHNLTIEGLHTYHVIAGDQAVLVHNDGWNPFKKKSGSAQPSRPEPNATIRDLLGYGRPDVDGSRESRDKMDRISGMQDWQLLDSIFAPSNGPVDYIRVGPDGRNLENGNHRAQELLNRAADPHDDDWDYDTKIYVDKHLGC